MDLLIKNVPDDAVESVKHMASVAIERHYRKAVVAPEAIQDAFEASVDGFLEDNGMNKKFAVKEEINPKV